MLIALWFLFGLAMGSFVNVVVVRLAAGEGLGGRSHCRNCGREIPWYHNLPLFSFAYLRGRCGACGAAISWQYPLVELACGVLFALAWGSAGGSYLDAFSFAVLSAYAVALFSFDLRFGVLPDALTLSGAGVLALLALARGFPLAAVLLGVAVGGAFFAIQYVVSRGRWIGGGDVRLGLLIGAALGWPNVAVALALAYLSGSLVALWLLASGKRRLGGEVPFGTFLSAATVVAALWGDGILTWYLGLVGGGR